MTKVHALPPVDSNQRYTIPEGCLYLKKGRSSLYRDIDEGKIRVIRDGGRVYVPGSELVRLSTLPAS